MPRLIVTIKTVYGRECIYPCCPNSVLLCKLTGKKTLTRAEITVISALGYEFEVLQTKLEGIEA